jgi:hypothetical protein
MTRKASVKAREARIGGLRKLGSKGSSAADILVCVYKCRERGRVCLLGGRPTEAVREEEEEGYMCTYSKQI